MLSATVLARYRADFALALFSCVFYGVYIVLAGLTIYLLLSHGQRYSGRRTVLVYTAYMSVVITAWIVAGSRMIAYQFLDVQFQPKLPNMTCSAPALITKFTAMLQILGSDGALIYRTIVLWERDKRVAIPLTLLYIVSFGCGVAAELFCVNNLLHQWSAMLHIVTYLTSIMLNMLTTFAIATRLWHLRARHVAPVTGPERRVMAILAILIESAALYTVVGVALIPTFLSAAPIASVLSSLFQCIAVLSPAAIFLRVAMGISVDSHETSLRSKSAVYTTTHDPGVYTLTRKASGLGQLTFAV